MHDGITAGAVQKREHRLAPAEGRDVPLGIREAAPGAAPARPTPVLLLHGATFGSVMFDLPLPGYSLQDFLAVRGWRSFALDLRGYGLSVPAPPLEAPPEANPPYARLGEAVDDLAAGVRFALEATGREAVHLVGFSWGTVVASAFAARCPQLLDRLVLSAPLYGEVNRLWIGRIGDPADLTRVDPALGAYRWVRAADIRARWNADIPATALIEDYREEQVPGAILDTLAATDPLGRQRAEPAFRVPNGPLVDLFEIFNGRRLYHPKRILAPTLIVRGHDDTTSTESDSRRLFQALGTPRKRYLAIAPGSHFLCAERNAQELFGEIELFLAQ